MLGLKKHFGSVDHLHFCVTDEHIPEADYRKQYMVIYDSVPGGTGYLKELMATPETLMHVFEFALDAMETCSCATDPDKDGCYHCLYAYRQSNKINNISRKVAVELLRKIVTGKDSIEKIKGISSIAVNTLFDSELEKRFIEAIEQASTPKCKIEITKVPVGGKEGYFLQIGSCCWDVELQVPFGGERGVKVQSLADFVFWPRSSGYKQRPVVVFTDGFLYHKDKVDIDTNKRFAIRDACHYPVWSITWKDVQGRLQQIKPNTGTEFFNPDGMPSYEFFEMTRKKKELPQWDLKTMSSFDLLLSYLAEPEADVIFEGLAQSLTLGMIEQKKSGQQNDFDSWQEKHSVFHEVDDRFQQPVFRSILFGTWSPNVNLTHLACIPSSAVQPMKNAAGKIVLLFEEKECSVVVRFDDRGQEKDSTFERAWSQYLFSMNLVQFLKKCLIVTEKGLEDGLYSWLTAAQSSATQKPEQPEGTGWQEIFDEQLLLDQEAISLALQLQHAGIAAPSNIGYEVDGAVWAEMTWDQKKIAVQLTSQTEYRQQLESDGWRVYPVNSMEILTALMEV